MTICRYFFSETIVFQKNICTFAPPLKNGGTPQWSFGEVAEWSIAAVLKTVVLRGTRGSNPCLSAIKGVNQAFARFTPFFTPKSQLRGVVYMHYFW